jgi:class 3 adenylate cyclase
MHKLIPQFIHDQYQSGQIQGEFQAVALFLDISGFTSMTQSLMQHGKEGAEALAQIINHVFAPIIKTIDEHGGFVTGFAGDAVTAVFPKHDTNTALAACTAALNVAQFFIDNEIQTTRLGDFPLAVKQGLSFGQVEWGIIGLPTHKNYYFRGPAIRGCTQAENQAQAGDIILDKSLQTLLSAKSIISRPLDEQFLQLIAIKSALKPPTPSSPQIVAPQIAAQFYPQHIWQMSQQGEFRDVATLFVSFQGHPEEFIAQVMTIVNRLDGFFVEIDFSVRASLFLVYFGAPVTHENDIERGLQFISMLQAALKDKPISWRIGMTFGTVYAGFVGVPSRDKYTCMGNIVNLPRE